MNQSKTVSDVKADENPYAVACKEYYSPEILEYLEGKYGSDITFEVETVSVKYKELYADGSVMGFDKIPVVVHIDAFLTAEVKDVDNDVNFIVTGRAEVPSNFGQNNKTYQYVYADTFLNRDS